MTIFLKHYKPKQMITIQHQERQIEIHATLSTRWIHRLLRVIGNSLDFSQVRAIEKQKAIALHEIGADLMRMM